MFPATLARRINRHAVAARAQSRRSLQRGPRYSWQNAVFEGRRTVLRRLQYAPSPQRLRFARPRSRSNQSSQPRTSLQTTRTNSIKLSLAAPLSSLSTIGRSGVKLDSRLSSGCMTMPCAPIADVSLPCSNHPNLLRSIPADRRRRARLCALGKASRLISVGRTLLLASFRRALSQDLRVLP
jgi:hypothetical protein